MYNPFYLNRQVSSCLSSYCHWIYHVTDSQRLRSSPRALSRGILGLIDLPGVVMHSLGSSLAKLIFLLCCTHKYSLKGHCVIIYILIQLLSLSVKSYRQHVHWTELFWAQCSADSTSKHWQTQQLTNSGMYNTMQSRNLKGNHVSF